MGGAALAEKGLLSSGGLRERVKERNPLLEEWKKEPYQHSNLRVSLKKKKKGVEFTLKIWLAATEEKGHSNGRRNTVFKRKRGS